MDSKYNDLFISISKFNKEDENINITLSIQNNSNRALHYISDIRALRYDKQSNTLNICLSDEGRKLTIGCANILPNFKVIDPKSTSEIRLKVPNKIFKLSVPNGTDKISFQKEDLTEAMTINIEVDWANVPYYKDTRKKSKTEFPSCNWKQHKAKFTKNLNSKKK